MKFWLAILCALVVSDSAVMAHPDHTGLVEIEWNRQTNRFEVSMKLRVADLEDAISAKLKRRWSLEFSEDKDQQLQSYLQKHFRLTFDGHSDCELRWAGTELLLHDVWVYFEVESGAGDVAKHTSSQQPAPKTFDELLQSANPESKANANLSRVVVKNTALMEIQPEQTFIVSLLNRGRRLGTILSVQKQHDTIDLAKGQTLASVVKQHNEGTR